MEKQRMTQQEALKELENLTIDYGKRTAEEIERLDEAVDMAIAALRADAVDRPTCDDAVSRAAAINAVKKNTFRLTFAEEQGCQGHVVWSAEAVYSDVIEGALLELPSAQPHDIARDIATIIENEKDMRVILKNAQPTEASCWGCNCTKMERLKEQKTFSEMVHLHDAETHDKHTETHACDSISRQAAIDALDDIESEVADGDGFQYEKWRKYFCELPSAQPKIIHCWECIYYDPEHIENDGVRYEYKDMPKDAFDTLGTGLVNLEYGTNVGGRCCRDYNVGYSEDKRVFVSKQNYCGRAERRTDE